MAEIKKRTAFTQIFNTLKYCLFLTVVFLSFPTNAASETCSYFAKNVETSFENYIRAKKSTIKQTGSSVNFNIIGVENDALQNLNNHIQIYRNLNCDLKILRQDMNKIGNAAQRGK